MLRIGADSRLSQKYSNFWLYSASIMDKLNFSCYFCKVMLDISIKAEELGHILGLPVTNTLLLTWLVVVSLIVVSYLLWRNLKLIPSKLQGLVELIFEEFFDFMKELYGSEKLAYAYFPFIATIFFFILFNNWFGILPVLGALGFFHQTADGQVFFPLFRTAASDINTTLPLAIISIIATHVIAIATLGFFKHASKYFTLSGVIPFFIGILEFIAEIAKMVSFSFRLFGNIFAGEVLLVIVSFLLPYIAPLPFYLLEIFVGLVQALVFAMLTMVFIKIASTSHDNEEQHA